MMTDSQNECAFYAVRDGLSELNIFCLNCLKYFGDTFIAIDMEIINIKATSFEPRKALFLEGVKKVHKVMLPPTKGKSLFIVFDQKLIKKETSYSVHKYASNLEEAWHQVAVFYGFIKRKTISINEDFSNTPQGRYYPSDGEFTGERFRNELILPELNSGEYITVIFDNEYGYGSSFIEEAFGGIVRNSTFTKEWLEEHLIFEATQGNQTYIEEAKIDIADAFNKENLCS